MYKCTTSKLNTESEQFIHTFKRGKLTTKFVMNHFLSDVFDLSDFNAQCTKERFQISHGLGDMGQQGEPMNDNTLMAL